MAGRAVCSQVADRMTGYAYVADFMVCMYACTCIEVRSNSATHRCITHTVGGRWSVVGQETDVGHRIAVSVFYV